MKMRLRPEKTPRLTFSNIFARGPPPPSPLPNTSSDVSEDSRFWKIVRVIESETSATNLMVNDAFVDVTHSSLCSICVCRRLSVIRRLLRRVLHIPTGVMWQRTCEPSIPTQLKVEWGKTLLPLYQNRTMDTRQLTHMLFLEHGDVNESERSEHLTSYHESF